MGITQHYSFVFSAFRWSSLVTPALVQGPSDSLSMHLCETRTTSGLHFTGRLLARWYTETLHGIKFHKTNFLIFPRVTASEQHLFCLCKNLMHLSFNICSFPQNSFLLYHVLQSLSLKYKGREGQKKQKAALCPFIEHNPPGEVRLWFSTEAYQGFPNLPQPDSKNINLGMPSFNQNLKERSEKQKNRGRYQHPFA